MLAIKIKQFLLQILRWQKSVLDFLFYIFIYICLSEFSFTDTGDSKNSRGGEETIF